MLLVAPVGYVFWKAFEHGVGPAWDAVTTPDALHALKVTLILTAIAVPANTIFGVLCALAIVRHRYPGAGIVNAVVDLPLALSPVVVGLALLLLYGRGGWLEGHGVVFALPGMVLATIFVSLPFVVREVVPVLREIGTEQEQAAATLGASALQTFVRVTWPAIRYATAYGIVLTTARALGEFGAVSVVSGRLAGETESLTLFVQDRYQSFDTHRRLCCRGAPGAARHGDAAPDDPTEAQRGNAMIEARGIVKRFGAFTALDGVSVDVPTGSLTALLGPSGSGKSTLLRVIAGLEKPDAGQVLLDGEDVTSTPTQSRGVGFVFQHYAAFKHMTVWDNVAFGLTVRRRPRSEIKQRVTELLDLVQLGGLAKRYPAQLSGGQRQRMGLARALAVDPKVLLLDEPFGALDARVRKELRIWLRRLHDETHTTTVIVTHDQEEAMDVADRVVVMNAGRIEQTAPPRELYDHPANEFVMSFVGPVNRLGDTFIRPHDVELLLEPNGSTQEAMVQRLVHLGFEVRVELVRDDGETLSAQLTREQVEGLELQHGQIVYVRPTRQTVFTD